MLSQFDGASYLYHWTRTDMVLFVLVLARSIGSRRIDNLINLIVMAKSRSAIPFGMRPRRGVLPPVSLAACGGSGSSSSERQRGQWRGSGAGGSGSGGRQGTVPAVPMGLAAAREISRSVSPGMPARSDELQRQARNSFCRAVHADGEYERHQRYRCGRDERDRLLLRRVRVERGGRKRELQSVSATPAGSGSGTGIQATINVLENRHTISPYVYGGSYPANAAAITDSGLSVVRWGGNATSTYNWKLGTDNADNDWYFEDFNYSEIGDSDSVQYIKDVKSAGSAPLMTMVMLPWVAQSAETSQQQGGTNNYHWSFSAAKYGAQCGSDPYNNDAGNGLNRLQHQHHGNDPNDAYFPLAR